MTEHKNERTCGGCGRVPSHYSHPCPIDATIILCGNCRMKGMAWISTGNLIDGKGKIVQVKR